nr:ankyrin repeat-containing protein At2g01680-like [Ipomoea batatas]
MHLRSSFLDYEYPLLRILSSFSVRAYGTLHLFSLQSPAKSHGISITFALRFSGGKQSRVAQLRENMNNTTLPGNKITLDLLGAIAKDDINQVENYIISPMDLMSYSVLCISCKMGSLNVAKSLANKNPHLCLEAGDDGRIPLHIAIMEGKAEIVKQLVLACPESLDYVTPHGETVIHFALLGNSNGDSCLNFLRQEIHRLDKHYLLEYLSPTNATTTASFEIEASTNSPQVCLFFFKFYLGTHVVWKF